MNNTSLIGRLTKDVDVKYTQSGKAVGQFVLAVNRPFKNPQGNYDADFISCVIWDQPAETLAQYAGKGSQIGLNGRIQTRNYDDKTGKKVYVTEIIVERFQLLEKREGNAPLSSLMYVSIVFTNQSPY